MGPLDCEHWSVALLCDFTSCKSICKGTNLVTSTVRHFGVSASAVYPSEHWSVASLCDFTSLNTVWNRYTPSLPGQIWTISILTIEDGWPTGLTTDIFQKPLWIYLHDAYQYNNKIKGCGGWENKIQASEIDSILDDQSQAKLPSHRQGR